MQKINSNSMMEHKKDMNITTYKKLNMPEHKTDMTITKIDKYKKKLNSNSMTEHKTDMNIIKYKKTKHDKVQNRHAKYKD